MVGALGKALARAGHEVRMVTPLYRGIRERFPQMRRVDWHFDLPLGDRQVQADLWSLEMETGLTVYFIEQPGFFDRAGIVSGKQHQLRRQRRALYFLFKMRRASRALSAVAAGRGACSRLADRAGPGVDVATTARRRVGESAADLPDHSQPGVSGHFSAGRLCADQPAAGIFSPSKARNFTAS